MGIVSLAVALAGVLLTSHYSALLWWASHSASWERTEGSVITSSAGAEYYEDENISTRKFRRPGSVSYAYEVAGLRYTGNRVSYERESIPALAEQEYPRGAVVSVLYDPGNPNRSVLIPGVNVGSSMWFGLWISAFVLIVFISLFISMAKRYLLGDVVDSDCAVREPEGLSVKVETYDRGCNPIIVTVPKSKLVIGFYIALFAIFWWMLFPIWLIKKGCFDFYWTVLAAAGIVCLVEAIRRYGRPRLVIEILPDCVGLYDPVGSATRGSGQEIEICNLGNLICHGATIAIPRSGNMSYPYVRSISGLPDGALQWVAALLLLLYSRSHVTSLNNSAESLLAGSFRHEGSRKMEACSETGINSGHDCVCGSVLAHFGFATIKDLLAEVTARGYSARNRSHRRVN